MATESIMNKYEEQHHCQAKYGSRKWWGDGHLALSHYTKIPTKLNFTHCCWLMKAVNIHLFTLQTFFKFAQFHKAALLSLFYWHKWWKGIIIAPFLYLCNCMKPHSMLLVSVKCVFLLATASQFVGFWGET